MNFLWKDISLHPENGLFVYGFNSVNQAIYMCLMVEIGEILFNPWFGSDFDMYLFEPMNESTAMFMRLSVYSAVTRWDPRVLITQGTTVEPDFNAYKYFMRIVVKVLGYSNSSDRLNLEYSFKYLGD